MKMLSQRLVTAAAHLRRSRRRGAEARGTLPPLPPADGGHPFGDLFLGVGAMKAGTTWIYAVLSTHPELHFALEKEIHFFYHRYVDDRVLSDHYRLREARNRYLFRFDPKTANIDRVRLNLRWINSYLGGPVDDHWYRNLFNQRRQQHFACDFSNLNAHIPTEAWPRIAASCSKLRVLFVMRDPVKRLWSHMRFNLQNTGQIDLLEKWSPQNYSAYARRPDIWENGEYGQILQRVCGGLPPENRLILFYEDLHADQRGTLRKIEHFLGISPGNYPDDLLNKRPTESIKRPMPDFFPSLFAKDVARIKSEVRALGFTPPASWG